MGIKYKSRGVKIICEEVENTMKLCQCNVGFGVFCALRCCMIMIRDLVALIGWVGRRFFFFMDMSGIY